MRMMPFDTSLDRFLGTLSNPEQNPILSPRSDTLFNCPFGATVAWEAKDVFDPAGVVHDGAAHLLYGLKTKTTRGSTPARRG